ncbi:hypothetical protein [Microlunatus sp. Gsoil 973]|uniref:CBU_0592 family membrane protein n=1 Tax=Microlunatus sp. Gsoil 973 TaxID=2672569 RepID=UPI0012B47066|nr:hypothetical protein [Microlunatus sp. Gsoil 973]QGN35118.1 hypothetical protein GJV80_22400 [Microlunatus sp. Gsoil 973]
MVLQIVQIIGSLLILLGFAAAQLGRMKQDSVSYLVVNTIGSGILAVLAFQERQWGFLLLEGTWCVVSVIGLIRSLGRRRQAEQSGSGDPSRSSTSSG